MEKSIIFVRKETKSYLMHTLTGGYPAKVVIREDDVHDEAVDAWYKCFR